MPRTRTLTLKREALAELTQDDLRTVVGAATVGNVCNTALTVFVSGCQTNPRVCHYESVDYC